MGPMRQCRIEKSRLNKILLSLWQNRDEKARNNPNNPNNLEYAQNEKLTEQYID